MRNRAALRAQAERAVTQAPINIDALSAEDIRRQVHELEVHQLELELQNDELRRTQDDLQASQQRYADLYHFAPVGYCTLDPQGLVSEANLTLASQLGVERGALLKTKLYASIRTEDRDVLYLHLKQVFETGTRQTCELRMVRQDGAQFDAHLESIATQDSATQISRCQTTTTDITERMQATVELQRSRVDLEALVQSRTSALTQTNARLQAEIAERQRVEQGLRELEKALETMLLGVTITDMAGTIAYTNPANARMHGYQAADLIGHDLSLLAPSERRPPMTPEEIGKMSILIRESEDIRQDGSVFPVRLLSNVVKDAEGRPRAIVTICEDITERKQAEQELAVYRNQLERLVGERTAKFKIANKRLTQEIIERRRAEAELQHSTQRLLTVIETVGEGISLSNKAGRFEIFNSRLEAITGYTKAEANARPDFLACLYPDPAERQQVVAGIEAIPRMGGSRNVETTIRAKDGAVKTLLVSTSTLRYQDGDWFLSAYHEITARKQTEKALQRATQLAEDAQQAAESANHAKSEFLANMSHELRTPLNAILGYAQLLLRDDNLTAKQGEEIEIIRHSGEHLLTLINDILDLAKIESHKMELVITDFHLPEFLRSIVAIAEIRAQQQGIALDCEIAVDDDGGTAQRPNSVARPRNALPAIVRGDEKRLRQILLNLLSNAIKFTKQGNVSLCVRKLDELPEVDNPQTPNLRFEIADTGIGIPADQLDAIFLPFHRVPETQMYTEGTGLGLTISRTLVRLMGGDVSVASTVGQGSRFWFDVRLPEIVREDDQLASAGRDDRRVIGFSDPATSPATLRQAQDAAPLGPDSGKAARTVLIADDKALNRTMLTDMLAPLGFEIIEAVDGHDTLAKAHACHPALILLDLVMPGLDGFEVARRIRQEQSGRQAADPSAIRTIIIAVSASAFHQTRQESLADGCDDFIAKPVQMRELVEKIGRHLRLEWIYASPTGTADTHGPGADNNDATPDRKELLILLKLSQTGHLRQIITHLDELEQAHPRWAPFATRIRQFTKRFQMNQMCTFLEHYLTESASR